MSYDHWRTNDTEGERREFEAECRAEVIADAWDAMGFRERADMIDTSSFRYATYCRVNGHAPYGYDRKQYVEHYIGEKLS